jgi:hypothetical protein
MHRPRALLTTLALLVGIAAPALAQSGRAGGVFDVLTDVLHMNRLLHGHVVQHREATLVLRGEDERTYTINTAGLDLGVLRALRDGRPVDVAVKSPAVGGGMPIAVSLRESAGPSKVFRRVEGVVDAVDDERIRFTTRDGATLVLDRSQIVGERPRVAPNETATLIYEQEPRMAGVWIETREVEPAAAPR